jgi:acetoin utilization deacetylase AcuC-like enzyme
MDILYHPIILEHETLNHPENKGRIVSLGDLPITELQLDEVPLHLVHTKEYINEVKQACAASQPIDADTQTSPKSWDAALYAVAATLRASEINGFAVVRPPGHHAHANFGSGFCLFNNIAIATQQLVNCGKRVLIFDFDGHLGDGTEEIFYKTNKVMYWSLHQFPAFPQKGTIDEIGEGEGLGYTINVPIPPKSGDDIYLRAVRRILPIAKQFAPDIVAVSAGFDAHRLDPLLDLELSANTYFELGRILKDNFTSLFATLEGGYNTQVLPNCLYNFLDGVNGKLKRFSEDPTESTILTMETFELDLEKLITNLAPYWHT